MTSNQKTTVIPVTSGGQLGFDAFKKIAERLIREAKEAIADTIAADYVITNEYHSQEGKYIMEALTQDETPKDVIFAYDYRTKEVTTHEGKQRNLCTA